MAVSPMPWKLNSDLFRLLGRLLAHKENNIYNSAHARGGPRYQGQRTLETVAYFNYLVAKDKDNIYNTGFY